MRKIIITHNPHDKVGYDYIFTSFDELPGYLPYSSYTDFEIDEGSYNVSSLADMTRWGPAYYHGHYGKTILMPLTNSTLNNPSYSVIYSDMIIMPSNNYKGDTRSVWYSNCNTNCQWANVLFLKSENGIYPTNAFIFTYNTLPTPITRNKYFNNCVFDSGIITVQQTSNLQDCIQIKQSDDDIFKYTLNNNIVVSNCHADYVDDNYVPLNHKDIGLYNGPYPWPSCSKFIKERVKQDLIQKTKEILVHYNV